MTKSYDKLPEDLPAPVDDGAAAHLLHERMPSIRLPSTQGREVDLGALPTARTVLFAYPMTGRPGVDLPDGWDDIPGARGCTPQTCAFRDLYREYQNLGFGVLAVSAQDTEYQREMVERLRVPYPVLSDAEFRLAEALRLPTFEAAGKRLLKRLTLVIREGTIEKVFYPVFPPDESAAQVLDWIRSKTEQEPTQP